MPLLTRARLTTAARYLLAVLLIAYILHRIDADLFLQAWRHAAVWTIPFIVGSTYLGMALQGVRWWLTQRPFAPDMRLRTSLAYHFLAGTYSVALPSTVAQDLLRTAMATRRVGHGPGWGAAWMNRIIGLVAWLLLCLAGLVMAGPQLMPAYALRTIGVSLAVLIVLLGFSFSKTITRPIRRLVARALPARFLVVIDAVREAIYQYRTRRGTLVGLVLLALGVELILVLCSATTAYGVSGLFPFTTLLLFLPLIEVAIMAVPLSPGGVAERFVLNAAMLTQAGLTPEEASLYSTLSVLGQVVLKGIGGLPFLLLGRWTSRKSAAEAES